MGILNKERARQLLVSTTTDSGLMQHALAVSAAMGQLAQHFNGNVEQWEAVGLLHDYDYQQHPEEHLQHTEQPLTQAGVDQESIRAILAHGWGICNDVEPQTEMEKSLYAVDELTGLIGATARMRPNGIQDLSVSSVKKKFKDKRFAAKVNRETIRKGSEMLGLELGDLINLCIEGMRPCAAELGLMGTAK